MGYDKIMLKDEIKKIIFEVTKALQKEN